MRFVVDEDLACMRLAELHLGQAGWWRRAVLGLGSAAALFAAERDQLAAVGLTADGIRAVRDDACWDPLEKRRRQCLRADIALAPFTSALFPALLREVQDPPPILYFRGRAPAELTPAVAVVGSRRPTRYGRQIAYRLASDLSAAGTTVLSGMAYGIDACAHAGALEAGVSAAVLACGLDKPYPRGNRHLFEKLARDGSVLSEQPPGVDARPYLFPVRNRIVTGMSRAVVVVEAAARSGSLVSARLALEQGRELFAVPGNIDSPTSVGTNALLRDGCAPCLGARDVLEALGLGDTDSLSLEVSAPASTVQDPEAARVLEVLEAAPSHSDQIAEACGLDGARVLELLTALELAGLAERSAGGFSRRLSNPGPAAAARRQVRGLDRALENRNGS